MIDAPVIHVNGDNPENVVKAVEIALDYRHTFKKDIVIDLIAFRKWGHNEMDEPGFTQPVQYSKIRSRSSIPVLYEETLLVLFLYFRRKMLSTRKLLKRQDPNTLNS